MSFPWWGYVLGGCAFVVLQIVQQRRAKAAAIASAAARAAMDAEYAKQMSVEVERGREQEALMRRAVEALEKIAGGEAVVTDHACACEEPVTRAVESGPWHQRVYQTSAGEVYFAAAHWPASDMARTVCCVTCKMTTSPLDPHLARTRLTRAEP